MVVQYSITPFLLIRAGFHMNFEFDIVFRYSGDEAMYFYNELEDYRTVLLETTNDVFRFCTRDVTPLAVHLENEGVYKTCLEDVITWACMEDNVDILESVYMLDLTDECTFSVDANSVNAALRGGCDDTINFIMVKSQELEQEFFSIVELEDYQGCRVSYLHLAALACQAVTLLKYLKPDESVDTVDSRGLTPLYLACVEKSCGTSTEDVEALLRCGANSFEIDPFDTLIADECRQVLLEHKERIYTLHKVLALDPDSVEVHADASDVGAVLQHVVSHIPSDLVLELLGYF